MTNHHNDPTRFLCYWNNLSGSFAFSGKPALTDFYFFYEAWVFLQATYVLFGYCYALRFQRNVHYDFKVKAIFSAIWAIRLYWNHWYHLNIHSISLWNKTCLNSDCQPYHRYDPLTLNNIEHKKSTTYGVKNLVSGLGYKPINEIPYGWDMWRESIFDIYIHWIWYCFDNYFTYFVPVFKYCYSYSRSLWTVMRAGGLAL
jgi:hypothetical protein